MAKFNKRESLVIVNALYEQTKKSVEYIKGIEESGKNPLFTCSYAYKEGLSIIYNVLEKSVKGSDEFVSNLIEELEGEYMEAQEKDLLSVV